MKIRGIKVSDHYTGLCNQLIQFLHGVLQSICDGIDIIVVDDFKMDLKKEEYCAFGEIVDLVRFSRYLYDTYGVMIFDRRAFHLHIVSVHYGTMTSFTDLTHKVIHSHVQNDCLELDVKTLDPPNPDIGQSVRISYRVADDLPYITKSYFENECITCPLKSECVDYHRYAGWPKHVGWMNRLIQTFWFHPRLYYDPLYIWKGVNGSRVHVIHVRLEYDAICHWAKENKMSREEFYECLSHKYTRAIETHVHDGVLLVLSHNSDNKVVQWLKETGRSYVFVEKQRSLGRECAAVYDMMNAVAHGNGVFIGNFDIYRMQGSTFSYFLMKKCRFQKHVLIDIERIHQDVFCS
jgi:hypothetical protein